MSNSSDHYDGLIGFSQGGVYISMLLRIIQEKKANFSPLKDLKFVMLICSNHWHNPEIDPTQPLEIPSIHLISRSDFLFRKSIFTTAQFKNPLVIYHDSGHSFPRLGAEEVSQIRKFVRENVANYTKKKLISPKSSL